MADAEYDPFAAGPHQVDVCRGRDGSLRVVAPELASHAGETAAARAAWIDAIIGSRVPDVQFLLDHLLGGGTRVVKTVLATPEVDSRVRSVVALAPSGSSNPKPGILPLKLSFDWGRDVPTLYIAAEDDVPIPLAGVYELFDRTPSSKRMFILRRADHQHFIEDVEEAHEAVQAATFPPEAAWIPVAMRPIAELSSGEQAHTFVRGLTLAHFDLTLGQMTTAERFLSGDVEADLAARGVEAFIRPHVTA